MNIDDWGAYTYGNYSDELHRKSETPVFICTSGRHYKTDSPNCGDGNLSEVYGIGDDEPAIGIGIAYPADVGGHPLLQGIELMYGDSSCQTYANHDEPTRWWEYDILNPKAGAYLFTADVAFESGNDGYYAVLTNCSLTPPIKPG